MIPDLFGGGSSTASVRRPTFEIAFGAGGGSGPADLLSSAAAAIGFGGASGEDPWLRSVASVSIDLGLAPEVDVAEIEIASDSQAPTVAFGDEGTISLGYADEGPTLVFTGFVWSLRPSSRGKLTVGVANASAKLSAFRVSAAYDDQDAGAIISDLASKASVDTGNISAGAHFPYLLVHQLQGQTWGNIARLARVSGYLASINADNAIDFTPPDEGEVVQTFTVGTDVLKLEATRTPPAFDSVTMSGEGAAGSSGKDAWNWLVKKSSPVTGSAGQGTIARAFADAALRTADSARGAAQALVDAAARVATIGTLVVPGAPKVRPGRRITIENPSGGDINGEYLVTQVRHEYSKRTGFRSHIKFAGSGGGAGGAGGLLESLL
jgi:phage protein D